MKTISIFLSFLLVFSPVGSATLAPDGGAQIGGDDFGDNMGGLDNATRSSEFGEDEGDSVFGLDPFAPVDFDEVKTGDVSDEEGVDTFTVEEDSPGIAEEVMGYLEDGAETVVGAAEGAGYLLGLKGDSASADAARQASVGDVSGGNAMSRALGAFDSFVEGVSFGLVDPGLSSEASNQEAAKAGRAFGTGGAVATALISGRGALKAGGKALANVVRGGAKALGGLARSIGNLFR